MQLYSCSLSLVVTSGEVGTLLSPSLFLWLEGHLIAKQARITVVSLEPDYAQLPPKRTEFSTPLESLLPFVEALYTANFPSSSIDAGVDTSDAAQRAVMTTFLLSAERKQESAMLQMSGMAGSYRGRDAAAMQRAMTLLLQLAQINSSHSAWTFLTGRYK